MLKSRRAPRLTGPCPARGPQGRLAGGGGDGAGGAGAGLSGPVPGRGGDEQHDAAVVRAVPGHQPHRAGAVRCGGGRARLRLVRVFTVRGSVREITMVQ